MILSEHINKNIKTWNLPNMTHVSQINEYNYIGEFIIKYNFLCLVDFHNLLETSEFIITNKEVNHDIAHFIKLKSFDVYIGYVFHLFERFMRFCLFSINEKIKIYMWNPIFPKQVEDFIDYPYFQNFLFFTSNSNEKVIKQLIAEINLALKIINEKMESLFLIEHLL